MIKDICENQRGCPGCQLKNLTYEKQLSYKMRLVINLMGRFHHVEEIIPSPDRYYYRNKVQYICTRRGGRDVFGMYSGAAGRVVPHGSCMTEDREASRAAEFAAAAARSHRVSFYDGRRGTLRQVTVRRGSGTDELMLIYVIAPGAPEKDVSALAAAAEETARACKQVKTAVLCENDTDTPLFISRERAVLFGCGYINEIICSLPFRLAPMSFRQVNSRAAEILYRTAAEFCTLGSELSAEDMTVFDAYCGTGVMGLAAAGNAKRLVGADTSAASVADAVKSAAAQGVPAEYIHADAAAVLADMCAGGISPDCVIADPPRAGLSKRFVAALSAGRPKRIVYVSCNPETLARDTAALCRGGYRVRRIQPIDMFPHTAHVETVVMLSHKKTEA